MDYFQLKLKKFITIGRILLHSGRVQIVRIFDRSIGSVDDIEHASDKSIDWHDSPQRRSYVR